MTLPSMIMWSFLGLAMLAGLIWAIRRWWRTPPRIAVPAWRSYVAIGALVLVGLSELLWIVSAVWVNIHGGEPYNPFFQWIGAIGFFATPASLFASLIGKGTLRWPACGLSVFVLFSWLVLGLAVSDL